MSASDVESSGVPERGPAHGAAWLAVRRTPVAFALIASCVLLWGIARWWGEGSDAVLWYLGANQGEAVRSGQVYRLLSCLFLHLGGVHLLLNMVALRALSPLESALGHSRFLLLYFCSGLGASLSTALLRPEVLSVGASGAIWGLMGAAFGMRIPTRHVLRARGVRLSSGWPVLAVNLAISFVPGVDMTAHLGGGLVGFLLGATTFYPEMSYAESFDSPGGSEHGGRASPSRARLRRLSALAAALLLAGSVVAALVEGRPWRLRASPQLRRVALAGTGLSLELPELIEAEPTPDVSAAEPPGWRFGSMGRSPIWLRLQPIETSLQAPEPARELPAEQLEGWLQQVREQLEQEEANPEVPRSSLEITSLGARRGVREEYHSSELRLVRYFLYVGPHALELDVFRSNAAQPVWPGVEEHIAASLRYVAPSLRYVAPSLRYAAPSLR